MNTRATPLFRDLRMPSDRNDPHSHERFLLDTLAERRAEESPSWKTRARVRAFVARGAALLKFS